MAATQNSKNKRPETKNHEDWTDLDRIADKMGIDLEKVPTLVQAYFADLTYQELSAIGNQIVTLKTAKQSVAQDEVKAQIATLMTSHGFTPAEAPSLLQGMYPELGSKRKTYTVAPKYRNPDDPSQTWTGRGRSPDWVVAAKKNNQQLTDMLITPAKD
jgi:DNA-binding protein H-NS